jgi:ribosomal protein S18 acetylase RimI-like enzyme
MNPTPAPSNSIIRPVQPTDRAEVLKIAHTSGLFPPDELDDIAATLDRYLTGVATDDRWILAVDDAPAGVAYYAPEQMTNGTWNLYMLAVDANQHRRGHGADLVRYVEDDLLTTGQGRLLLIETSGVAQFAGQRTFYTKLGYQLEAQIRDFYNVGDDKMIYRKTLTPTDRPILKI